MQCPVCLSDTKVTDSRAAGDGEGIRRRRECLKCSFRFSTVEEMEILNLMVLKRDGTREPYVRQKVEGGIRRALEKRPSTDEDVRRLVSRVERDIQVKEKGDEIPSEQIGTIVMRHLKRVDPVAYIRFASVYKSFQDVQSFQQELKNVRTPK